MTIKFYSGKIIITTDENFHIFILLLTFFSKYWYVRSHVSWGTTLIHFEAPDKTSIFVRMQLDRIFVIQKILKSPQSKFKLIIIRTFVVRDT